MLRSVAIRALFVAFITGVVGCATSDSVVDVGDFAQHTKNASPKQAVNLEPGDSIEISVEVDGRMEVPLHRAKVDFNGFVTLPVVGDVMVGGFSLDIARAIITKRYGALYVSKPVIMLNLLVSQANPKWGSVTVMGSVAQPGRVPIRNQQGMKLTEAIQLAGGFAPSAKKSSIKVTRSDRRGMQIKVLIDFNEIGREGNADSDIKLIDGDIIYVPERIF